MKNFCYLALFFVLVHGCQNGERTTVTENTTTALVEHAVPSSWPSSGNFPLNLRLGSNFDQDEIDAIASGANAWTNSAGLGFSFFSLSSSGIESKDNLDSFNDSEYGVYKLFSWPTQLPETALAVTQLYGIKRNLGTSSEYIELQHADILLNYDYFSFSVGGKIWGYDLTTVVVHEMGHFLGLYHSDTSPDHSVMYPTLSKYNDNPMPHEFDIDNIKNKYSKLSSSNRRVISGAGSSPIKIIIELYPTMEHKIHMIETP